MKKKKIVQTWEQLLKPVRLGRKEADGYEDDSRDEFDRDYDRIVFCSDFRRLQDKTQVFPLSQNDFTRTRLTHSLEVSCVGRSLGRKLRKLLTEDFGIKNIPDIGIIVATACLAHDIGNPPFGHSGESAIQKWAKENVGMKKNCRFKLNQRQQVCDLHEFEGNAQGLRVVSRIQARRRLGGLQLTVPTVAAMMKYPCGSIVEGKARDTSRIEQKKFNYFQDDQSLIAPALRRLGMIEFKKNSFRRHPLAFLVEAADDICYVLIDLEDSVDMGLISLTDACELVEPIARRTRTFEDKPYEGKSRLPWLRAYAINSLILEVTQVFRREHQNILEGTFPDSLINHVAPKCFEKFTEISKAVRNTAYKDTRVLQIELAGFQVIKGLLDYFVSALVETSPSKFDRKLQGVFPETYLMKPGQNIATPVNWDELDLTTYQRILAVTDYISGMTDSFAVDLFQKISGIKLPV